MHSYSNLKKRNSSILTAAVSLLLCVVLSGTLLFSRMVAYAPADTTHYIPLTRSGGITTVTTGGSLYRPGQPQLLAASPFLSTSWFRVTDENGAVWKGETSVDIFRTAYVGGSGSIMAESADGEKIIAPGTGNTYTFALENTQRRDNVQYEMTMEAYFSHEDIHIPVDVKVWDYTGTYYAGSAAEFADVLELNKVSTSGTLRPGYVMPFSLQWQWPMEEDDAWDTFLGNLQEDEELTLTIVIHTTATYTPSADGGIPKTGDTSHIQLAFTIMVTSAAGLLLLFLFARRKGEENEKR